jgi:hypothetical protein
VPAAVGQWPTPNRTLRERDLPSERHHCRSSPSGHGTQTRIHADWWAQLATSIVVSVQCYVGNSPGPGPGVFSVHGSSERLSWNVHSSSLRGTLLAWLDLDDSTTSPGYILRNQHGFICFNQRYLLVYIYGFFVCYILRNQHGFICFNYENIKIYNELQPPAKYSNISMWNSYWCLVFDLASLALVFPFSMLGLNYFLSCCLFSDVLPVGFIRI